jgi:phenylacetic acid degradation operon negative regulatory protein
MRYSPLPIHGRLASCAAIARPPRAAPGTGGGRRRNPAEAWDLPAVGKEYDAFIDRWSPLLPRIAAGEVTGASALRARTEVMDTYRRFPVLDPMLPDALMPPDWPRRRARDVFVAIYDGLLEPAQEHVRAVVASVADGPRLDIRAHSVAHMAAGVRHDAD